jgi:hypothetical protein
MEELNSKLISSQSSLVARVILLAGPANHGGVFAGQIAATFRQDKEHGHKAAIRCGYGDSRNQPKQENTA